MTQKSKLVLITGLALLLTLCSFVIDNWADKPEQLRLVYDVLDVVKTPALLAGIVMSGNIHSPNEFTIYVGLFIIFWLFMAIFTWLFILIRWTKNLLTKEK